MKITARPMAIFQFSTRISLASVKNQCSFTRKSQISAVKFGENDMHSLLIFASKLCNTHCSNVRGKAQIRLPLCNRSLIAKVGKYLFIYSKLISKTLSKLSKVFNSSSRTSKQCVSSVNSNHNWLSITPACSM